MEACAGSFGVRRAAAAATVAAVDTVQLPYGVAVPGVGAAEEGGVRRVDEDERMGLKEVLMISLLAVSLEEYGVLHTVVIPLEEVVSLLLPATSRSSDGTSMTATWGVADALELLALDMW